MISVSLLFKGLTQHQRNRERSVCEMQWLNVFQVRDVRISFYAPNMI